MVVRAAGKPMDTLFAVRISRFVVFEDAWHVSAAPRP